MTLPTSNQVLRCYMFYKKQRLAINRTKSDNAKIVLRKIMPFYEKANIPMITEKKACEKVFMLFQKNAKLRELPTNRRSSVSAQAKLKEAELELSMTFPLWANNANSKNEEDLQFLHSMMLDRAASFGPHDRKLVSKLQYKLKKILKEEERKLKAKHGFEPSSISVEQLPGSKESSSESEHESACQFSEKATLESHR